MGDADIMLLCFSPPPMLDSQCDAVHRTRLPCVRRASPTPVIRATSSQKTFHSSCSDVCPGQRSTVIPEPRAMQDMQQQEVDLLIDLCWGLLQTWLVSMTTLLLHQDSKLLKVVYTDLSHWLVEYVTIDINIKYNSRLKWKQIHCVYCWNN